MINGVTRSSAFQITQTKINHLKKLNQIAAAKNTIFKFEQYIKKQLRECNQKHARAQSLKRINLDKHIKNQNRKMVMSMCKIAFRKTQYPNHEKSKNQKNNSNFFVELQKKKRNLSSQNLQLIEKLVGRKSEYSFIKDNQEFRQSRQRLKRMERFNNVKRLTDRIQSIERLVSQTFCDNEGKQKNIRLKTMINPEVQGFN